MIREANAKLTIANILAHAIRHWETVHVLSRLVGCHCGLCGWLKRIGRLHLLVVPATWSALKVAKWYRAILESGDCDG
jgi:hypothetical protein